MSTFAFGMAIALAAAIGVICVGALAFLVYHACDSFEAHDIGHAAACSSISIATTTGAFKAARLLLTVALAIRGDTVEHEKPDLPTKRWLR